MIKADKKKSEICAACRELYQQMNFKEITIKEISRYTSFSRPSIYNYFATKESIFLEIFREEYALWCQDMDTVLHTHTPLTIEQFADKLAHTLDNRPMLLKLLSMNIYDLEENCTLTDLIAFKQQYKQALDTMHRLITAYFPQLGDKNTHSFIYTFFPFMFGLYPYTHITPKQKEAMETVGIDFPKRRIYDFVYQAIVTLLSTK